MHLNEVSVFGDMLTLTLNNEETFTVDLSRRKVRNIPASNRPSEGSWLRSKGETTTVTIRLGIESFGVTLVLSEV